MGRGTCIGVIKDKGSCKGSSGGQAGTFTPSLRRMETDARACTHSLHDKTEEEKR